MTETTLGGITIICGFLLIILFAGDPALLDVVTNRIGECR